MKKILAMMLALVMVLAVTVQAATFPDLEEARWDWARETVEELAGIGIVKGYSDGTYKPENSVTKEEAFTLFARVIGVNDETNAQAVADAQKLYASVAQQYETYAVKELCFLLYRGILEEADLAEYLALDIQDTPMKRHEAAKLITRILDGEEEVENAVMFVFDYTDADAFPNEAKGYISYVTEKGIMSGMGDGTFSPDTGVTRAQIAIMLKRTMNMLDVAYISGPASAVDETSLVVNGQSYEISEKTIIHRNGEAATIADIENGDAVTLTTTYKGLLAIDANETDASESNTAVIEGIYRGSLTDSRGTYIKVYDKELGTNSTESYKLADVVSYILNGEPVSSLGYITETDYVYVTMAGGIVTSIVAESKTTQVDNATLATLMHDGENNIMTIEHRDMAYDGATWPISENVYVKRNGKTAALTDLLVGDAVNITVNYGEITSITATSKTSTVKGTISEIHIAKDNPYITIKISDEKSQALYLTMDTVIDIDATAGSIYDLELGYNVTVTTESSTATKITVASVAQTTTLTGTVTLVNPSLGFINISMRDPATGEVVTKQIFVNEKTAIRAGSNAAPVKLTALVEGDSVFATGAEKIGAFEATTILVINK